MKRNALNVALTLALSTLTATAWAATQDEIAAAPAAAGASGADLAQIKGETVVVTASRMVQPLLDVDASMASTLTLSSALRWLRAHPRCCTALML